MSKESAPEVLVRERSYYSLNVRTVHAFYVTLYHE